MEDKMSVQTNHPVAHLPECVEVIERRVNPDRSINPNIDAIRAMLAAKCVDLEAELGRADTIRLSLAGQVADLELENTEQRLEIERLNRIVDESAESEVPFRFRGDMEDSLKRGKESDSA